MNGGMNLKFFYYADMRFEQRLLNDKNTARQWGAKTQDVIVNVEVN